MPKWLVVVLVVLGLLALLCCGAAAFVWRATKEIRAIADLPEEERPRATSDLLRKTFGDADRPLLDFQKAVDERRDDDAWAAAGDGFRSATTREQFGRVADIVRERLGPSRELFLSNLNFRSAAGVGNVESGQFLDVQYGARFEKGDGSVRATLAKDAAGVWRVHSWRVESPLLSEATAPEAPAPAGTGK